MQARFTSGVFGIITDDKERVLLCRRTDIDFWNLPGGKLESGETPWSGVIREVLEETGLQVAVTKLSGIYSKAPNDEIVFVFACRVKGGSLQINTEARAVEYFPREALPEKTLPNHVSRINDFFANSDQVTMKVQRVMRLGLAKNI